MSSLIPGNSSPLPSKPCCRYGYMPSAPPPTPVEITTFSCHRLRHVITCHPSMINIYDPSMIRVVLCHAVREQRNDTTRLEILSQHPELQQQRYKQHTECHDAASAALVTVCQAAQDYFFQGYGEPGDLVFITRLCDTWHANPNAQVFNDVVSTTWTALQVALMYGRARIVSHLIRTFLQTHVRHPLDIMTCDGYGHNIFDYTREWVDTKVPYMKPGYFRYIACPPVEQDHLTHLLTNINQQRHQARRTARHVFLMATHPRVGRHSPVRTVLCASRLYDAHVLRYILAFIPTPSLLPTTRQEIEQEIKYRQQATAIAGECAR